MKDMTGLTVGRLTVTGLGVAKPPSRELWWNCSCTCGKTVTVRGNSLREKRTQSCGCLSAETAAKSAAARATHGEGSNGKESAEYVCWSQMKTRCSNPKHPTFPGYGGRGITVCERWQLFTNFLADMGRRPTPGHSLDRIDNDKGYSPENCRWATHLVQNNNRRQESKPRKPSEMGVSVLHGDREQTVALWVAELGITPEAYRARRAKGMTIEQAATTPRQPPGVKARAV